MLAALLDRERELAEVRGLIEAAREGFGGSVVVEGPAGIGKPRLLASAFAASRAWTYRPGRAVPHTFEPGGWRW